MIRIICASLSWILAAIAVGAQPGLYPDAPARPALVLTSLPGAATAPRGSLFPEAELRGFLAPPAAKIPRASGSAAARLRDLIARAEAGPSGYDAVQYGARIKPGKPPTRMTLAEIDAWIDATPGQPHAIGRYQFIPKTLRWLSRRAGLAPSTRFSPAVQDRLADLLLQDAGLDAALTGDISRQSFMLNLARIWAGLPTASGKSYYDGYAGNSAVLNWLDFRQSVHSILDG